MIAIIENSGANVASILFALKRLGMNAQLTSDSNVIKKASHVILPGVGNAMRAMKQLETQNLISTIKSLTQPILGICLGMQLLFEFSEEGNTSCLNIISGKIQKIISNSLTVPHMGWNTIKAHNNHPILKNIPGQSYFYFVHSYAAPVTSSCIATTEYETKFAAIVQHQNFIGTQFHPERSGEAGTTLLQNFIELSL